MKFFIPFATDSKQEDEIYGSIKMFLSKEQNFHLSDRKVFSLDYEHESKSYYAEVGKTHSLNNEPVIAILYDASRKVYCVCTTTRGVEKGIPILVGEHEVNSATDFVD